MKKIYKKHGFTLVETLVGVSIFVLVMTAVAMFARNTWLYNTFVSSSLNNVDTMRSALKTMTTEIRTASPSATGTYAISQASATSFTFYSDIDTDQVKEKVRYFLSSGQLRKGVIKPTGSPLTYNPANEVVATLLSDVINASIFDYYNKNYEGTTAALAFPIDIASVRLVKITVTIDKDTIRPPPATTFSTQVSIRNLKDNL